MSVRFQDFISRHRKKFVITGILIGGTYFAIRYAQRKLIEIQERQAREFIERTRRLQHFELTERTCNGIIITMSTELCQAIFSECNTEDLLKQLRESPPNSVKVELWGEIKLISFTRITTLIYATSMLAVALRVQLNLVSGYLYRNFTTDDKQLTDQLKQQYLSLLNYFVHDGGLSRLVNLIKSKVNKLMKVMPLHQEFNIHDIEQLFWSLQMSINSDINDPVMKMSTYLLPSEIPDYNVNGPLLQKMFNETLDLLESDDATTLCSTNICRGFTLAIEAYIERITEKIKYKDCETKKDAANDAEQKLQQATASSTASAQNYNDDDSANVNNMKLPLAQIIPQITGLTSEGFNDNQRPQNLATNLVSFYILSDKLKLLGANIYETFSCGL